MVTETQKKTSSALVTTVIHFLQGHKRTEIIDNFIVSRKKNHVCVHTYILCFRIIYVCYKCQTLTIIERKRDKLQIFCCCVILYKYCKNTPKKKNISKHQQPHENVDKQLFEKLLLFYIHLVHVRTSSEEQVKHTTKQDRMKK